MSPCLVVIDDLGMTCAGPAHHFGPHAPIWTEDELKRGRKNATYTLTLEELRWVAAAGAAYTRRNHGSYLTTDEDAWRDTAKNIFRNPGDVAHVLSAIRDDPKKG